MFKKIYLLLFLSATLYAQTTIDSLRINSSTGVPIDTGKVFTVSGIVTSGKHFGTSGPGSIQDGTAAISVYGSSFAGVVTIGDSVTVTGVLSQYNGLSQIDLRRVGAAVTKHSSGHSVEPKVLTLQEITSQTWNGFEEYESQLIRINNVTISSTGNFAGNTSLNITDSTATLTGGLRIDNDVTSIIGTPIPSGKVDIIGILGQYKSSAPFSSGYQIMPRFVADIVHDSSPLILNPVMALNIDTSSFVAHFKTARNGNSQVKYGLTEALELDSVVVNVDTTFHLVKVSNLSPATTYFFKAYSSNAQGTSVSEIQKVTTASKDTTLGTINVYFNFSVDTTIALPDNKANSEANFVQKLISRINNATSSIDMALYSFFGMQDVVDALLLAKSRGVKIRVVYDSRSGGVPQNSMQSLITAGVKVSQRPNDGALMHNKFFIFDARDTVVNNDWIWTGSWNVTSSEVGWKNNVVEINDPALAQAYKIEFEEMWGSNSDSLIASSGKFGNKKLNNTPHFFNIGGREVALYFSPSDQTETKIKETLLTADTSIYVSMYAFTSDGLQTAIKSRFDAGAKDIRCVIDQQNTTGSEFAALDVYADVWKNVSPTMHHKYAIVDAQSSFSSPYVITGSHNWSRSANEDNDENTLIIKDHKIANLYLQEFKKRYNEAGGTMSFVLPSSVNENNAQIDGFELFQNYPNPFNPVTTIRFNMIETGKVDLSIYNVLGQKIKTIYEGIAKEGMNVVDFNAQDLPSGVYIYKLNSGKLSTSKKLVLMK